MQNKYKYKCLVWRWDLLVRPSIHMSAIKAYDIFETKQFCSKLCVLCHEIQLLQSYYIYVYDYDNFMAIWLA
jgi:hypothetical protein